MPEFIIDKDELTRITALSILTNIKTNTAEDCIWSVVRRCWRL